MFREFLARCCVILKGVLSGSSRFLGHFGSLGGCTFNHKWYSGPLNVVFTQPSFGCSVPASNVDAKWLALKAKLNYSIFDPPMEARFCHWIKNHNPSFSHNCKFTSRNSEFSEIAAICNLELWDINSQFWVIKSELWEINLLFYWWYKLTFASYKVRVARYKVIFARYKLTIVRYKVRIGICKLAILTFFSRNCKFISCEWSEYFFLNYEI